MNCATQDIGTATYYEETVEDRYKRCGLLNVIQHIDIYGKYRSLYVEKRYRVYGNDTGAITSVSTSAGRFWDGPDSSSEDTKVRSVSDKLSKYSVSTKVSGLYPGHDILSKKARNKRTAAVKRWCY